MAMLFPRLRMPFSHTAEQLLSAGGLGVGEAQQLLPGEPGAAPGAGSDSRTNAAPTSTDPETQVKVCAVLATCC